MSTKIQFADAEFSSDAIRATKLVEMTDDAIAEGRPPFYIHVTIVEGKLGGRTHQQGFETRDEARAEKDRIDAEWPGDNR